MANTPPRRVIKRRKASPPIVKTKPLSRKAEAEALKNPTVPKVNTVIDNGPTSEKYRQIAEYHLPNRIWAAAASNTPAHEFLSFLPTRCYWCMSEHAIKELRINGTGGFVCINTAQCQKAYKLKFAAKSIEPKRRVIRKPAGVGKSTTPPIATQRVLRRHKAHS